MDIKVTEQKKNTRLSPKLLLIGMGSGILFILLLIFVLNYLSLRSRPNNTASPSSQVEKDQNAMKIIAQVGDENIYQKDLNTEISYYPVRKEVDAKNLLLQKIIKDSIILQAGQADGLIKLDPTVFNSLEKDYLKRIKLIETAKKAIENKKERISGSIISLWFYNGKPGAIGYEKGKELALNKITNLHNDVKSKKITIEQASQEIINDQSLSQIDTSFDSNALLTFTAGPKDTITFDPGFDAIIRKLQPRQISEIYLAKDKDNTGKLIDAVYMFGEVSERKATGSSLGFDEWYAQKEKYYEIINY